MSSSTRVAGLKRVIPYLVLLAAVGTAGAQSATPLPEPRERVPRPWEDPEAKDRDDEQRTSRFWDQALHPDRERFKRELGEGARLLASRRPEEQKRAVDVLRRAVALEPDDPRGLMLLGHAHHLQRQWAECAAAYQKLANLDPRMTALPALEMPGVQILGMPGLVDVALGQCLSLAGDHLAAVHRLRRAMNLGSKDQQPWQLSAELPWRLGEATMALGRLEEAIVQLRRAAELQGSLPVLRAGREPLIMYALAAAYDRDEQIGKAREILQMLAASDGGRALGRSDLRLSPPEEALYYQALVLATPRQAGERTMPPLMPAKSVALFRRYLELHGSGQWARRARTHLDALRRDPLSTAGLVQTGHATVDTRQVTALIARADETLQRCVKDVPTALFEINADMVVTGGRKRRNEEIQEYGRPTPRGPGVNATVILDQGSDAARIAAAVQCLDAVAQTFKFPPPRGSNGEYARLVFPIVWQGP